MIDEGLVEEIRAKVIEINSISAKDKLTEDELVQLEILKKSLITNISDLLIQVNSQ